MTTTPREKVLSKIRKCFALAKSGNPNEAGAALREAQKLKHGRNDNRSRWTVLPTMRLERGSDSSFAMTHATEATLEGVAK